jgi:hypothetical protein
MLNSQYNTREVKPMIGDVVRHLDIKDWDVHPDFQRPYVWKIAQQRRLIESVLLGYTLPTFFGFERREIGREIFVGEKKNDGSRESTKVDTIVTYFSDGQQRLETLRLFLNDKFKFKTERPELEHLNNKTFSKFDSEARNAVLQSVIKIEMWPKDTPDEIIQDHYDRINTGGKPLTYGHIRRNRYKGVHYDFLADLAMDKTFHTILGSKANKDNMLNLEHEVQAWIYCANIENKTFDYNAITASEANKDDKKFGNYKGNPISPKGIVESFLQKYKEDPNLCTPEYKKDITAKFKKATRLLNSVFGVKSFAKPVIEDGVWKTDKNGDKKFGTFNLGIYEILMYLFTYVDESTVIGHEDEIRVAYYAGIRSNPTLQTALWYATTSDESTRNRYFGFLKIFESVGMKFNW